MTDDPHLPSFAVAALLGFLRPIAESRPPDMLIGGADDTYLRRWFLTPRGDGPAVYLHHFLRSDDDRALHDHPWASVSILLDGHYWDHRPDGRAALHLPGDIIRRQPQTAHRVQLLPGVGNIGEAPVWTLFLVGERVREWGFHCPQGWRHWRDFTAGEHGETVGRGCA